MRKKYFDLSNKIFNNSHKIWYPDNGIKNNKISNSWFKIDEYHNPNNFRKINRNFLYKKFIGKNDNGKVIKCKMIKFFPNKDQKKILLNWFEYARLMYNRTIKYFKSQQRIGTTNWRTVRNNLRDIKRSLINNSDLHSI